MKRVLLLTALALPGLVACGEKEKEVDAVVANNVAAVPVEIATIESTAFQDTLELVGKLEPFDEVKITAEVPGRIESVPFDDGQTVRKGQVVARIDAKMATAQVQQATAQHELATATLERTRKMAEKGLAPAAELEVVKAQASQAEAALELTKVSLDKAVINAPIRGVVTNVKAKKGEIAAPGVPLLEIVRVDKVKVVAEAPERDVALLEVGSEAQVIIPAFPGRVFMGTIEKVGVVATSKTRTFPVEIGLDNKDGTLRPGMLANIRLMRRVMREVVVVPRDAVIDDTEGKSVFVAANGVAQRRNVEVGSVRGPFAVARSGLRAGDRLIVLGHRQVVDGQKIDVNKESRCCAEQVAAERAAEENPTPAAEAPAKPAAKKATKPGKKRANKRAKKPPSASDSAG
jgi:membrane fusion protein (multidrug efflux system)